MYTVNPGIAECYYLRLFVHEVRGPESFMALKNVVDVVYPTFQVTCRALVLLEDNVHWDRTLKDASIFDSPYKIRELFAIMMIFCQVGDLMKLWEKYRDDISQAIRMKMDTEKKG